MGSDRTYQQVQRELANVTVRPLLIICERSWRPGEVPDKEKKVIINSVFQKAKKDWGTTDLTASPQSLKRRYGTNYPRNYFQIQKGDLE